MGLDATIEDALRELEARNPINEAYVCGCIGPQNGEPLCPCEMRGVVVRDGRYYRVEELGPVKRNYAASYGCREMAINSPYDGFSLTNGRKR